MYGDFVTTKGVYSYEIQIFDIAMDVAVSESKQVTTVVVPGDVNGDGYADLIVGAKGADADGLADAGKAYLRIGPLFTNTGLVIEGDQVGGRLGSTVAMVGDVNGDGFEDMAVAAEGYNSGIGVVFLFLGSRDIPVIEPAKRKSADNAAARFSYKDCRLGATISTALDMFGDDGYDDIAIGSECGLALIIPGMDDWSSPTNIMLIIMQGAILNNMDKENARIVVASIGDIDVDGKPNLIIGYPEDNYFAVYKADIGQDGREILKEMFRHAITPSGNGWQPIVKKLGYSAAGYSTGGGVDGQIVSGKFLVGAPLTDVEDKNNAEGASYLCSADAKSIPLCKIYAPISMNLEEWGTSVCGGSLFNSRAIVIDGPNAIDTQNIRKGSVFYNENSGIHRQYWPI